MFKRPRLSAQSFPVNAGIAGFLLFYAASCSGPQEPAENEAAPDETASVEQPATEDAPSDSLPAVWSTDELDHPVRSIGIAGGAGSTFAIAYEGGGLQVFNFDGERVTGVAETDVKALSEGRYAMLSGTPVTFFPGIDSSGDLKVWIHGGQLPEAIEYDLKGDQVDAAAGLCAAPPLGGSDALHRLAYWSNGSSTLQVGEISEVDGELAFTEIQTIETANPIAACTFTADGVEFYSPPTAATSNLRRMGRETLLSISETGQLSAIYDNGETQDLDIQEGITVRVPPNPTALAAVGDARGGGYPGGVIVLGGTVSSGNHRAVLVDPSRITLTPISVPPGEQ